MSQLQTGSSIGSFVMLGIGLYKIKLFLSLGFLICSAPKELLESAGGRKKIKKK